MSPKFFSKWCNAISILRNMLCGSWGSVEIVTRAFSGNFKHPHNGCYYKNKRLREEVESLYKVFEIAAISLAL